MELPQKIQNQLAQYRQLEQQAQALLTQRQTLEFRVMEIDRALEELGSFEKGNIYRSIGNLLVKAKNKESVVSSLEEEKETLEVRVKTLGKQTERLRKRLQSLQQDISTAVKSSG